MMTKQLVTALSLIAVSVFAWAGSGKVSFQDLDANRDGQITLSEAKKSSEVSQKFSQVDINKDGKLDAAEFSALETKPMEGTPGGYR
jgi:Ca2+-binding EF-hand superfamily protein